MNLKGKKVNFLGDSITEGYGPDVPENSYVNIFARKTGATVRNYGIGGTRMATPRTKYGSSFCERIDIMDPDADIVVVFGGTNDAFFAEHPLGDKESTDTDTFFGALNYIFPALHKKYPTSLIICMTPIHRCGEQNANDMGFYLRDCVSAIKTICEKYSVPLLDLWSLSGIQPNIPENRTAYTKDGTHPNDLGCMRIASLLIDFTERYFKADI